jgi:D-glycero-D-manno-heptose 1,7-bisphosphate phosphatase
LGYIHIKTEKFFDVLDSVDSLQDALVALTTDTNCATVNCENSLTSVSNISRFNALRKQRKTILLDRDGILNEKMPHRTYLSNFRDYVPLVDNLNVLKDLYSENTDFIIITNQPGVATGAVDPDFLDRLHSSLITDMLVMGISVIGIYVCTHHWEENCPCRKPKPGMILQAITDFELNPKKIVYVGDEIKDVEAAMNAGVAGIRLTEKPISGEFKSFKEAFNSIQAIVSM